MNKKNQLMYDQAVTTLFVNLYSIAKKDNIIKLKGFDYKKPQHILILHTAHHITNLWPQMNIEIEMSFINKIKFHFSKNYLPFKRVKKIETEKTCDDYIEDIEKYYYEHIFFDIAVEYYYGDKV